MIEDKLLGVQQRPEETVENNFTALACLEQPTHERALRYLALDGRLAERARRHLLRPTRGRRPFRIRPHHRKRLGHQFIPRQAGAERVNQSGSVALA